VFPDELAEKADQDRRRVVSHGRCVTFGIAEVAMSRKALKEILMLIARLRAPPAPPAPA
jgi:hypothetical protein